VKKFLVTLFALSFLILPTAQAARPVIRIVDKPHINFDGAFRDNELAASLLPNGKLGTLIFAPNSSKNTYVIDAGLVDEVRQMAQGYSFNGKEDQDGQKSAQNWLFRLKYATAGKNVVALPYGNPDERILKSIAPAELTFYSHFAQARLESFFGRSVSAERGWGTGRTNISSSLRSNYSANRKLLTGLTTITTSEDVIYQRARIALLLNPQLNKEERTYFSYNARAVVQKLSDRLRVSPGRYQITSRSTNLPVTLINNFDTATVVSVSLIPLNSRIQVENLNNIAIAPKSRLQILVPVKVIAPGSTLVLAQFMNSKGQLVGQVSKLNLTATIIDSRVAWFTTGAAVLLFLGAVTQSVRRIRRSRA
jgi:Family of unknown function (DUF6049)